MIVLSATVHVDIMACCRKPAITVTYQRPCRAAYMCILCVCICIGTCQRKYAYVSMLRQNSAYSCVDAMCSRAP